MNGWKRVVEHEAPQGEPLAVYVVHPAGEGEVAIGAIGEDALWGTISSEDDSTEPVLLEIGGAIVTHWCELSRIAPPDGVQAIADAERLRARRVDPEPPIDPAAEGQLAEPPGA